MTKASTMGFILVLFGMTTVFVNAIFVNDNDVFLGGVVGILIGTFCMVLGICDTQAE